MQDVMRVQASLELSNVGSQMSIGVNAIAGLATAFAIGYYLASGHGRTTVRTRRLSVVQPGRSMAARKFCSCSRCECWRRYSRTSRTSLSCRR